MRSVLFAYHDIGYRAIETMLNIGQQIVSVFTHEDDPGENVWFGSVLRLAQSKNIIVHTPANPNTPDWIERIRALKPDAIFSFYYRRLISDEIISLAPKGAFNLHGSLLPRYRGRAPVNWAIVNGEKETGLTLHYMVRRADAGDIVAQRAVAIAEEDTALSLYKKLLPKVSDILRESVPLIETGRAPRIPQDETRAATFKGRKPEDGLIRWTMTAEQIYNLVRAVTHPYPGAFTFFRKTKVLVWQCSRAQGSGSPGTVLSTNPLTAACGADALKMEIVQEQDKPETSGEKWCGENNVRAGDLLGGL